MAKLIQRSVILSKGGKGEAVQRLNPVTKSIEEVCRCWINADFSRGCIAQVHVSHLPEVVDNNGHYAPGNLRKYHRQGLSNQRCTYCYSYRNLGGVEPKIVSEKTQESFRWFNPEVIRIGKLTEAGHPYYYQELIKFLGLCQEFKSRVIFPNKMFSFGIEGVEECHSAVLQIARGYKMQRGKDIAQLLKSIRASLMYSIGYDAEEPGAVSQGFTNAWRIRQAEQYHKRGVNVSLTVVCDVARSIEDNVNSGSHIEEAIIAAETTGLNLRILPLRPFAKNMPRLCGGSAEELAEGGVLTGSLTGINVPVLLQLPYKKAGNNQHISQYFHPEIKKLVEQKNLGVCGKVGNEHCDACNLEHQRLAFPASELVQIDYSRKKTQKKYGTKSNGQKRLF
jgi:hypothetical protein